MFGAVGDSLAEDKSFQAMRIKFMERVRFDALKRNLDSHPFASGKITGKVPNAQRGGKIVMGVQKPKLGKLCGGERLCRIAPKGECVSAKKDFAIAEINDCDFRLPASAGKGLPGKTQ